MFVGVLAASSPAYSISDSVLVAQCAQSESLPVYDYHGEMLFWPLTRAMSSSCLSNNNDTEKKKPNLEEDCEK